MREVCANRSVIFETQNVSKYFGKLAALNSVSILIREKEITSLIGPNGAGKTTFYDVITGRFPPSSGHIFFKGKDITGLPPYKILKRGVARSFQITNLFNTLTVLENIRSAIIARSMARLNLFKGVDSFNALYEETMHFIELIGLEGKVNVPCANLSHGDMRAVEIGIALASGPEIIFLDEPTQGMTQEETGKMVRLIKNLSEKTPTTFFVIEHDMSVVFSISDRIIVLFRGQVLADSPPGEIRTNPKVKEAYLGGLTDATG
jgi:branched-chain amino acid transport system ATP-binding protein